MARGQQLKKDIAKKILETFPGSFLYNGDKEIRIGGIEDGEEIQIKVALTAAKENVFQGADNAIPGENTITQTVENSTFANNSQKENVKSVEPTEEEKQNVADLLRSLGL